MAPSRSTRADDEHDEARYVVDDMKRRKAGGLIGWSGVAVFYRTNAQSRVLEEHLMDAEIPYTVIGGTRFYDRREVRDAVAYLKTAVNPDDEVSCKRALNIPRRGVGPVSVSKIDSYAAARGRVLLRSPAPAWQCWRDRAGFIGR